MKSNMGTLDRIFRIIIALIIGGLYFAHVINGVAAIILLVVAAIFATTSFIGFCPLYYPFGISTRTEKITKA